ncbi:hypothetical protein HF086_006926 [Spodoptera exigua]|uniref:Uncharacterized protein n=1 Tax=Spodoptera exigua TaxID=7107 RepID=A0A922MJQ8_SPOEX|nr:hypothetical protein HF086_006926 [Spodoptera exigua]
MDDFFKNIRSTPINIDNIINADPIISEIKMDESKSLKEVENKPEDNLCQLPQGDNINQQIKYDESVLHAQDAGEIKNILEAKEAEDLVSQANNENFKGENIDIVENSKDDISIKTPCIGEIELVENKHESSTKPIEMSNGIKDTKDEVTHFRSTIYDSVMIKTNSLLEIVTNRFNGLVKEAQGPNEEKGEYVSMDDKPLNYLIGKFDNPVTQPVDAEELNEKLNEISLQSQAALEELKNQSIKIIDTARAQTNKVIENARYNVNMFTKPLEEIQHQQKSVDETYDEDIEKYVGPGLVTDFFS